MAWFKLNDSLNTLKDQLSNVSHVVQEAFQEDPDANTNADNDPWHRLETEKLRSDELSSLCGAQSQEISTLRRQIQDLQLAVAATPPMSTTSSSVDTQQLAAGGGGSHTKQSNRDDGTTAAPGGTASGAATTLEDSWFWESEPATTATTSASSAASSAHAHDLKSVPLDDASAAGHHDADTVEQFKRARIENAILNAKLTQLNDELRQSTVNIERLDGEHTIAIDEVLHMKTALKRKCTALEVEVEQLRAERTDPDVVMVENGAEKEALRAQLEALLAENTALKVSAAEMVGDREQSKRMIAELESSLAESKAAAAATHSELQQYIGEWNKMLATIKELQSEVDRLAEEKLLTEGKWQLERERLAGESKQSGAQIDALELAIGELEAKLELAQKPELDAEPNSLPSATQTTDLDAVDTSIPLQQLAEILQPYAPIDGATAADGGALVARLRDTLATIDQFKFDMESLAEQNHQLGETNARVQHQKETAQADLHHYEQELAEVMKNNELLIAELDAFKASGKLETISEQNEDNIVHLEQQLEDCSNLNQSLEDEYQNMRNRLEAAEQRVVQLEEELRDRELQADAELNTLRTRLNELEVQAEIADGERSTLAFELAELRANERPAEVTEDLRARILCVTEEKLSVERRLAEIEAESTGALLAATATIDAHLAEIAEQRVLIEKKTNDVQELLAELHKLRDENIRIDNVVERSMAKDFVEMGALSKELGDKSYECSQQQKEITRLNKLLDDQKNKPLECTACTATSAQLAELRRNTESACEEAAFLREKTDAFAAGLLAEQEAHKRSSALCEKLRAELAEQHADGQRLRTHLLEVEEAHTQETMEMQHTVEQLQVKMAGLEQEARKSSTAYTSASIRANQHTETLQAQYALLVQQRDDFSAKLSAAEDKESRSEAALINLQCALEQFQNNKERDIVERTQLMQRQLDAAAAAQQQLHAELRAQQQQLAESKNGLLAAARITDQLETAQMANTNLHDELRLLRDQLAGVQQQLAVALATHADKVEKGLLKNLLIGYVSAPNAPDKQQVLKLIASVLEFEAHEEERVGLGSNSRGGQLGWLGAIRNAALVVGQSTTVGQDTYNKEGIAQAFVRFLENESKPKEPSTAPSLLNIVPTPSTSSSASASSSPPLQANSFAAAAVPPAPLPASAQPATATSEAPSTAAAPAPQATVAAVQPILINDGMLQSFAPARNTSTILKDILSDS